MFMRKHLLVKRPPQGRPRAHPRRVGGQRHGPRGAGGGRLPSLPRALPGSLGRRPGRGGRAGRRARPLRACE
eukprot:10369715-Alexandrium_andersonii.AAC.1